MPSIRLPSSANPLLTLCKGHGDPHIFKTYADFAAFLVAFGYKHYSEHSSSLPTRLSFLSNPNAIALEVFENRRHDLNFLMIALAYDSSRQIAEDEEQLCNLMERLASLGGELLNRELIDEDPLQRLKQISALLTATSSGVSQETRI